MNLSRHKSYIIFSLILVSFFSVSFSQTGGKYDFKVLTMTTAARTAALGTNWMPLKDGDINNVIYNPSLINSDLHHSFALNYINYVGEINYGYAIYSHTFDKVGSFAASVQYINYGSMKETDINGDVKGDFSANEMAMNVGWGRTLTPRWSIGTNFKLAYSNLYSGYNAVGIGVDVAGSYVIPDQNIFFSLVVNNIGGVISSYDHIDNNYSLPFFASFGFSQKLEHLPLRYVITYNNIEKWDLSGNSVPRTMMDPITGETSTKKRHVIFGDNLMRHFAFGIELTFAKVINLRGGYNYGRRQELKTETKKAMTGFSFGIGLNFKRFSIDFGRSLYHLSGSPNFFTFSANIDRLTVKRTRSSKLNNEEN